MDTLKMNNQQPPVTVYETDLFRPVYQPFQGARWRLQIAGMVLCQGYWSPARLAAGMAALLRVEDGQARTWMSMTPMEIESQELGCRHASGHVVVMGLGMGWAAANAALNPAVTRVTVVEHDPEVIEVVGRSGVFDQLPAAAAARLTIIPGDARSFVPDSPADTLLADIWLPLFDAGRAEEVRTMRANTGAGRVYFWGQEMIIADRARRAGWALTAETVSAIVADLDLPLIGPEECPDYPERIASAAAKWLKPV